MRPFSCHPLFHSLGGSQEVCHPEMALWHGQQGQLWVQHHICLSAHSGGPPRFLRLSYQHTQACWSHRSSQYGRSTCSPELCSNTVHCGRTPSRMSHTHPCLREGWRERVSQGAEPWKQGRLGAEPTESQHGTLAWITGRSPSKPPASPTSHTPGRRGGSTQRQNRRSNNVEQDTFTNRKFMCVSGRLRTQFPWR